MEEYEITFWTAICLIAALIWFLHEYNKRMEIKEKSSLFVICPNPNCGYQGTGKKSGGTSGCLLVILLLLGVLPGILYLLFCGKPGVICPRCGIKIR